MVENNLILIQDIIHINLSETPENVFYRVITRNLNRSWTWEKVYRVGGGRNLGLLSEKGSGVGDKIRETGINFLSFIEIARKTLQYPKKKENYSRSPILP